MFTVKPPISDPQLLPERRRFPRLKFRESVSFRDVLKPHQTYSGALAKDLSSGGVRMTTQMFLSKDSRLVVLLALPGLLEPVRAIARVAWSRKERFSDQYECGVEFISVSPEDQKAVAGHVKQGIAPALA